MEVVKAKYHDYLLLQEKLSKYTNDLVGKDRLFRLGVYICRLILAVIDTEKSKHIAKPLTNLEKSLGHTRRVIRLGKVFALLQSILVNSPRRYATRPLMLFLDIIRNSALLTYNLNDHVCWIGSQHIFEIDTTWFSWRAAVAWFISLIMQMMQDYIRLKNLEEKERNLKREVMKMKQEEQDLLRQSSGDSAKATELISSQQIRQRNEQALNTLRSERIQLYINFIKNFADFPLALSGSMRWKGPNAPIKPWVLGLCGTFSSAIAVYQSWGREGSSASSGI